MSGLQSRGVGALTPALLTELATLDVEQGAALLYATVGLSAETVTGLAEAALRQADAQPEAASRWLAVATADGQTLQRMPAAAALAAYARARLRAQAGDLPQAEADLRAAQELWRSTGEHEWLVRSDLGLTQVLAMQGRYAEAEAAVHRAIRALESTADAQKAGLALPRAYRNLATLLVYQDRHGPALAAYDAAVEALGRAMSTEDTSAAEIAGERAHLRLNRASALTFLDRPEEAEQELLAAITGFGELGDPVNRARAETNLGRLYLRTGRYADALALFDRATSDLVGDVTDPESDLHNLRLADELLLEHATAYLALNLLPEADAALRRCEHLFRAANQPYELAQALWARGVLLMGNQEFAPAQHTLEEAQHLLHVLDNRYWQNRVRMTLAALALRHGELETARAQLGELLPAGDLAGAEGWDIGGYVEVHLLNVRLALAEGDPATAELSANRVDDVLGKPSMPAEAPRLPHLALRLFHALGQIALAAGRHDEAARRFMAAIELLEQQRAGLPLEEVRTAFVEDKANLYSDLVVSLLEEPGAEVKAAAAFDVVERARSRALLERMQASMGGLDTTAQGDGPARKEQLRRQLHWLYNRLLGEGGGETGRELEREVRDHEHALRALEWRGERLPAGAAPVTAGDLQDSLARDQQAVVYYTAGAEVLAFVVSRAGVAVARKLCSTDELGVVVTDLRFQMGRVEVGRGAEGARVTRLLEAANRTLAALYGLLIAPLEPLLDQARWMIIPYGSLHLLPFHAFRRGDRYLVQEVEISYSPSASVAVHCAAGSARPAFDAFAGLAIRDPGIPQAEQEILACAHHFASSRTYVGNEATRTSLREAAAAADVLHVATHGLFRPDNSFFSALKLADGWVDVRELYRLPLRARLVVLSACESGAGEIRGGDEVIGLARGFLGAGASSLVASLWNVHDSSTVGLMTAFYGALLGESGAARRPAQALAAAQRSAIAGGQHPYYWAPFVSIG
jgi:CHAT domain-containing protein